MSVRTQPPFRADHVGSFRCVPPRCSTRREQKPQGRYLAGATARSGRTRPFATSSAFRKISDSKEFTDGEFRRTYFTHRFSGANWPASRPRAVCRGQLPQRRRQRRLRAAGDARTAPVRHVKPIQVDDFKFLRSVTKRTPKVTIPVADHAAFPRRARSDQPRSLSRPRTVFRRRRDRLSRRDPRAAAARDAPYLQLDDTNLAYLCDTKMREGAQAAWRRPGRVAAPLCASDTTRQSRTVRPA